MEKIVGELAMQAKTIAQSKTEQVHILMPMDINGTNRLFGGVLMQWIDVVAAVVARRHAECDVTTAAVDSLKFLAPAVMNETVILIGNITCVGKTSMEIRVDTYVEALSGERTLVNKAYVVMVAVDEHGTPQQVPGLVLETDEQRTEWDAGQKRREMRVKNRTV